MKKTIFRSFFVFALGISLLSAGLASCRNDTSDASDGDDKKQEQQAEESGGQQTPPWEEPEPEESAADKELKKRAETARELQKTLLKDMAGTWQIDSEYEALSKWDSWFWPKTIEVSQSGEITLTYGSGDTESFTPSSIPEFLASIPENLPMTYDKTEDKAPTMRAHYAAFIARAKNDLKFFPNDKDVTVRKTDPTMESLKTEKEREANIPDALLMMETQGGKLHVVYGNMLYHSSCIFERICHYATYSRAGSSGPAPTGFKGSLSGTYTYTTQSALDSSATFNGSSVTCTYFSGGQSHTNT